MIPSSHSRIGLVFVSGMLLSAQAFCGAKIVGKTSGSSGALPTFTSGTPNTIISSAFPSGDSSASHWNLAATFTSHVLHLGAMLTTAKAEGGSSFVPVSSGTSSLGTLSGASIEARQSNVSCTGGMGTPVLTAHMTLGDAKNLCADSDHTSFGWVISTSASTAPSSFSGETSVYDDSTMGSDGVYYLVTAAMCDLDAGTIPIGESAAPYRTAKITVSNFGATCTVDYSDNI